MKRENKKKKKKEFITDINKKNAAADCADALLELITIYNHNNPFSTIIILCIGTDRATGDALGPITGHLLSKKNFDSDKETIANDKDIKIKIFGTLSSPAHAVNLDDVISDIYNSENENPFIIAIDACLGKSSHIGRIIIRPQPIYPGAAINNRLAAIGDISIVGIVNASGSSPLITLQTTRLGHVMHMAEIIAEALEIALLRLCI